MHPLVGIIASISPRRFSVDAGADVSSSDSGFATCGNPGTTGAAAPTVSGGVSPFTYLWEQIGTPAANGPYDCSNSASATPTWTKSSVCDGDSPQEETWRLTVTDARGVEVTDTIFVDLEWINLS